MFRETELAQLGRGDILPFEVVWPTDSTLGLMPLSSTILFFPIASSSSVFTPPFADSHAGCHTDKSVSMTRLAVIFTCLVNQPV